MNKTFASEWIKKAYHDFTDSIILVGGHGVR